MTTVKSYGHYISVLTHLLEDSLRKIVADHGRLEGELKRTEEALNEYKLERACMQEDMDKYEREKKRLDGVVETLTQDKKRLSDELEKVKKVWEAAQLELGKCNEMSNDVAAHFPKLAIDSSLAVAVEELKESVAESFEDGFKLALAQMLVLYPDADESQFDAYKVVRNEQIVEEEEEEVNAATTETPVVVPQPAVDIAAIGEFLLNNEGLEEDGDGSHGVEGQE